MTISAYILRWVDDDWLCLVHLHKKLDVYMQIGGHIELDETPWQAAAHEIAEESGYSLSELDIVQHSDKILSTPANTYHPMAFVSNTHKVGNEHYHSDSCYGFVAEKLPQSPPEEGESADLRWLTLIEMEAEAAKGKVLADTASIYQYLIDSLNSYVRVPARDFSLGKPRQYGIVYKR